jgi:predicted nucleic acid-binding protein
LLVYVDTSMLVKRYLPELGSQELEARLIGEQPEMLVSELVLPELSSALRRRERKGLIDARYVEDALEDFHEDVRCAALRLADLDTTCIRKASSLIRRLQSPLATLDAVHLATALEHGCDILFTSDAQLSRAAGEAGLACWPQIANA